MRKVLCLLVLCLLAFSAPASDVEETVNVPYGKIAGYEAILVVFEDSFISIRIFNVKPEDRDAVWNALLTESGKISNEFEDAPLGTSSYSLRWQDGSLAWDLRAFGFADGYRFLLQTKLPASIKFDGCVIIYSSRDTPPPKMLPEQKKARSSSKSPLESS